MEQVARSFRMAFTASSVIFSIWYAVGLLLLGTDWVSEDFVEMSRVWGDVIFLLLAAAVTFFYSATVCGARVAAKVAATILAVATCAELFGAVTGYPFGHYQYSDNLGPRLFGIMPVIIPFCWLTIVLNAFWISLYLFQDELNDPAGKFMMIMSTAFLAVLTDLSLEPVASLVKLYWVWLDNGAGYHGIPGVNFFGWWLVTFFTASLFYPRIATRVRLKAAPWPAYMVLASINLLFGLVNYRAGFLAPVFFALNGFGGLAILMVWREIRRGRNQSTSSASY